MLENIFSKQTDSSWYATPGNCFSNDRKWIQKKPCFYIQLHIIIISRTRGSGLNFHINET